MATFTNTPELSVAEILSSVLGKSAGSLSSVAMKALQALQTKLLGVCSNLKDQAITVVSDNVEAAYSDAYSKAVKVLSREVKAAERVLDAVEATFNAIEASLAAVSKTLSAIEAPLRALSIALKVITVLTIFPIPPAVIVVLTMLSELIVQIRQIVSALKAVVKFIKSILDPVKAMIQRIRNWLNSLKVSITLNLALASASSSDIKVLRKYNIIDKKGVDIFNKLGQAAGSDQKTLLGYGDLGDIDITSTVVQNAVSANSSGSVQIPIGNMGDSVCTVYSDADLENQPETPVGSTIPPAGWSQTQPGGEEYWQSKSTISGKTGVPGVWSIPEKIVEKNVETTTGKVSDKDVNDSLQYSNSNTSSNSGSNNASSSFTSGQRYETLNIIDGSTIVSGSDLLKVLGLPDGGVVTVEGSAEIFSLVDSTLDILDNTNISPELKKILHDGLDILPTVSEKEKQSSPEYYYTSGAGDVYDLNIVIDPDSPEIAPRRYVEVVDASDIVVYTGTKTFATSDDVLIEETKVRLKQLLG